LCFQALNKKALKMSNPNQPQNFGIPPINNAAPYDNRPQGQPVPGSMQQPIQPLSQTQVQTQQPLQQGQPISQILTQTANKPNADQMKSAANKINPPKAGEKKDGGEKSKAGKKLLIFLMCFGAFLVPIPRQVGGEVEIEGTPSTNQALIRPEIGGTVEKILAKTGQPIKAGETIAIIKNWDLEEKTFEAEKQLARLKASLGPIQSQIRVAQEEYQRSAEEANRQKAESDFVQGQASSITQESAPPRIEQTRKQLEQVNLQAESLSQKASLHKYLADEGVYPRQSALQSAYEAASAVKQTQALKAQLQAEESELKERSTEALPKSNVTARAASANLSRVQSAREELYATQSQIREQEKQIDLYEKQKDQLNLKSPIDGIILTLKTDLLLGQNFNRGDTLAIVANPSRVKVSVQLSEEERSYIEVGQKANVRFRAIPNKVFKGIVDQIAPVTSETGEQTSKRRIWSVSIVLDNPGNTMKPGMTGYSKIQTGKWSPIIELTWTEIYKAFRLDRYI
jgi:multidrug resistance efflux pump